MAVDLHTHSRRSDGTDTPAAVIAAAAEAGLTGVALTDHDTTAGWDEAAAALPVGMLLVRGAEFSTHLPRDGRLVSVHLLGYLFDPAEPRLAAEMDRLRSDRLVRGLAMVDKMVAAGVRLPRASARHRRRRPWSGAHTSAERWCGPAWWSPWPTRSGHTCRGPAPTT